MLLRFLAGRSREEDATALAMSSMYSGEQPGCVWEGRGGRRERTGGGEGGRRSGRGG